MLGLAGCTSVKPVDLTLISQTNVKTVNTGLRGDRVLKPTKTFNIVAFYDGNERIEALAPYTDSEGQPLEEYVGYSAQLRKGSFGRYRAVKLTRLVPATNAVPSKATAPVPRTLADAEVAAKASTTPEPKKGAAKTTAVTTSKKGAAKTTAVTTSKKGATKTTAVTTPKKGATKTGAVTTPKKGAAKTAVVTTSKKGATKTGAVSEARKAVAKAAPAPAPKKATSKSPVVEAPKKAVKKATTAKERAL